MYDQAKRALFISVCFHQRERSGTRAERSGTSCWNGTVMLYVFVFTTAHAPTRHYTPCSPAACKRRYKCTIEFTCTKIHILRRLYILTYSRIYVLTMKMNSQYYVVFDFFVALTSGGGHEAKGVPVKRLGRRVIVL